MCIRGSRKKCLRKKLNAFISAVVRAQLRPDANMLDAAYQAARRDGGGKFWMRTGSTLTLRMAQVRMNPISTEEYKKRSSLLQEKLKVLAREKQDLQGSSDSSPFP